jgi:hypothetical protein
MGNRVFHLNANQMTFSDVLIFTCSQVLYTGLTLGYMKILFEPQRSSKDEKIAMDDKEVRIWEVINEVHFKILSEYFPQKLTTCTETADSPAKIAAGRIGYKFQPSTLH